MAPALQKARYVLLDELQLALVGHREESGDNPLEILERGVGQKTADDSAVCYERAFDHDDLERHEPSLEHGFELELALVPLRQRRDRSFALELAGEIGVTFEVIEDVG